MIWSNERGDLLMIQQKIEQELQPYIKRNVITSIVDGILNAMAMGLIPL